MNRSTALNILQLPKNATREQIEESYHQLRALYYPNHYGKPHEFTTEQMQENLYAILSRDRYKEPKGVQYKDFVKDTYHYALTEYAQVCQAYEYLTDAANQNEYNVDPNSPYGHDVLRYGPGFANVRKVITGLVNWLALPALIVWLVSGLLNVMGNGEIVYFGIIAGVSKYLYIAIMGSAMITMPRDVLLFIPEGICDGVREGAGYDSGIAKPLTILWGAVLGCLRNAFTFFLKPREMMDERDYRCDPPIKNAKKGRAAAAQWYQKTLGTMAADYEKGLVQIDEDMPSIRKALKALAERYKYAKIVARATQTSSDLYVQRAEKDFDRQDRVGWLDGAEMEDALDDINKARDSRERVVSGAQTALQEAGRVLCAFARRAGANPDDYID